MEVELFKLSCRDWVPNNKSYPVMTYRVIGPRMDSDTFGELFAANGWDGIWRNGVFAYHHYHSGAHEVLGVERGFATTNTLVRLERGEELKQTTLDGLRYVFEQAAVTFVSDNRHSES